MSRPLARSLSLSVLWSETSYHSTTLLQSDLDGKGVIVSGQIIDELKSAGKLVGQMEEVYLHQQKDVLVVLLCSCCWNAPMNSCRWIWGTRVIFFVGSLQHMSHKKGAKENNKHSKKLIDQQLRRSPLCPPTHCLKSFLVLSRWGFLVLWVGSWQRSSYTYWEAALQLVGWTS